MSLDGSRKLNLNEIMAEPVLLTVDDDAEILRVVGVQVIVRGLSRPTNTGGISLNWPLHENGLPPPETSGENARSSSASSMNPASNIS